MAPQREFKYDVSQLMTSVRERPVLWDRTLEIYKDKVERKNAWDEIFTILDPEYEHMSWEEKRAMGEYIINKWTNIRDTFVKSLKNKMGKPKKRYIYHEQLKFLTKVVTDEDYNEDYSSEEPATFMKQELVEYQEGASSSYNLPSRKSKRRDSNEGTKKSKRKRHDSTQDSDYETYDTANIDFVEVDSKVESDPRVMNEDEAFFASLLPTIVRYNEDDRLEFRIEVLAAMRKIKDKKRWQGNE